MPVSRLDASTRTRAARAAEAGQTGQGRSPRARAGKRNGYRAASAWDGADRSGAARGRPGCIHGRSCDRRRCAGRWPTQAGCTRPLVIGARCTSRSNMPAGGQNGQPEPLHPAGVTPTFGENSSGSDMGVIAPAMPTPATRPLRAPATESPSGASIAEPTRPRRSVRVTIPRYGGHGLRPTRPRRAVLC